MMILRGCARCGGDIVTRDVKNVRCLQCGHRPELPVAELKRRNRRARPDRVPVKPVSVDEIFPLDGISEVVTKDASGGLAGDSDALCPRCDESDAIALEKLRPHFNTCFRCRLCGHIFSPAEFKAAS